jgi:hypothetical protein
MIAAMVIPLICQSRVRLGAGTHHAIEIYFYRIERNWCNYFMSGALANQ